MMDGRFCNMNIPENDDSFRLGQGNILLVTVTPTPVTVTSFLNISSLVTLRTPSPTRQRSPENVLDPRRHFPRTSATMVTWSPLWRWGGEMQRMPEPRTLLIHACTQTHTRREDLSPSHHSQTTHFTHNNISLRGWFCCCLTLVFVRVHYNHHSICHFRMWLNDEILV